MLDFLRIAARPKKDFTEVYPKFIINPKTKDLMVRGGDFYAVWDYDNNIWSKSEQSVITQIDAEINKYIAKRSSMYPGENLVGMYMEDSDSGSIDRWHKYVQKQMRDCFHPLDEKLIFSNQKAEKKDYVSHTLSYPLEEGPMPAYEELASTLYDPVERAKFEWAIGSIVCGDSKKLQKFIVFYGDKGSGKSTILDIIELLFEGFTEGFKSEDLGTRNNAFALEAFKDNPLVAIDHEGKLDKIENNTVLNSLVAHDRMVVNAKYEKKYSMRFHSFLIIASNDPVKITNAKSGILRRLIDINPSGRLFKPAKYFELKNQVKFELGAIAFHCLKVYKEMGESYYANYLPKDMLAATNDFYDYIDFNFQRFKANNYVTLSDAWALYKEYCEFAGANQMPYRLFRGELKNYFKIYEMKGEINGKPLQNLYREFRVDKFETGTDGKVNSDRNDESSWLDFTERESVFDKAFANSKAQMSNSEGNPFAPWSSVLSTLSDIDTSKEHWVKPDAADLVMIDFDKKDINGNKSLEENIKEAKKWPQTYAELSKSGQGIHLYYYYKGNLDDISSIYDLDIEIKIPKGNSSIRRKLTKCNDIPIMPLQEGGLPKKEVNNVIDWNGYRDEKHLHNKIVQTIKANLNKERGSSTSESINFIREELDKAYASGLHYDVSDLQNDVLLFAMRSTNQSERCVNEVGKMHFKSDDISECKEIEAADDRLVFFDCECYSNFFGICWKYDGSDNVVKMVNPSPAEVESLFAFKLVGFNNRKYDNHLLLTRARGYSNEALYKLSQEIINNHTGYIGEAYNLSYTDVFDYCTDKRSLKKWEIELDITHEEMGIPWDEPLPDDKIEDVMNYCANDVRATEAVHHARVGDFNARKIQVAIVKQMHGDDINVTVNDTTNTLSKRITFGRNTNPQIEFNYRDLSLPVGSEQYEYYKERFGDDYKFRVFDAEGFPVFRDYIPGEVLPDGWSILPFFKGYTFDQFAPKEKSHYLGDVIGEGGRNYSAPGYYEWVWDGDITSQHPHSMKAEVLLGKRYQKIVDEIVEARVAVKHKDFEKAGSLLGGALKPYLNEETYVDLAQALKIVINSIYGLTSAKFPNEFKDERNVDNIVAKRGALFMTLLKQEVEKRGFKVCHIKTDSIKIPNADENIKKFVCDFAKEYGYNFETEAIFSKFLIINDSAYVGWDTVESKWVTKADQFKKEKQPFLFKTLFSHEPYEFKDFCEVMSVKEGAIYLDMNEDLTDVAEDEKIHEKIMRKLQKAGISISPNVYDDTDDSELQALREKIRSGHNLKFVGRVGQFTPVKPGAGGGILYRVQNGKRYAIGGTTGYRWYESAHVKKYGIEDLINKDFYRKRVDETKDDISEYVDVEFFISDEQPPEWYGQTLAKIDEPVPDFMNIPENAPEEIPFDELDTKEERKTT